LDKPNGINLLYTDTHPIKVTKLVHNDPEGLRITKLPTKR
jgi:hypothetical protein